MHQLELLGGVVGGLTREGSMLQLGHHTDVVALRRRGRRRVCHGPEQYMLVKRQCPPSWP
jgi:hypothetical protein